MPSFLFSSRRLLKRGVSSRRASEGVPGRGVSALASALSLEAAAERERANGDVLSAIKRRERKEKNNRSIAQSTVPASRSLFPCLCPFFRACAPTGRGGGGVLRSRERRRKKKRSSERRREKRRKRSRLLRKESKRKCDVSGERQEERRKKNSTKTSTPTRGGAGGEISASPCSVSSAPHVSSAAA